MSDPANVLLISAIREDACKAVLWVVDENLPGTELNLLHSPASLTALTNRVDVASQLESKGLRVVLADFDFQLLDNLAFDTIYYRVSKEKPLVHHIINNAYQHLAAGGELILTGSKQEGLKTYASKATQLFGKVVDKYKGAASSQLIRLQKIPGREADLLDDKAYTEVIEVPGKEVTFFSKPGLYGWKKIDQGSQLLIAHLPQALEAMSTSPAVIVDLGCGYGYLSVMASRVINGHFIATDNNIAAVNFCQRNFSRHRVNGDVLLADCGHGLPTGADLVLCNPPFHQGFGVEGDLTDRFLASARQLLKKSGYALFVVNSFIPIEKKARALFADSRCLCNNKSFKVMLLQA